MCGYIILYTHIHKKIRERNICILYRYFIKRANMNAAK